MISIEAANKYCNEDISLIENYEDALNDTTQTWHCHHRLEEQLNLTADQLKAKDLYFNRPASELIFLTRREHAHLNGKNNYYPRRFRKQKKINTSVITKEMLENMMFYI